MHFEKRTIAERDACEIEAEAFMPGSEEAVTCLIRDLPEKGARLELRTCRPLPPVFGLAIPVNDGIVDRCVVELRWHHGDQLSVRFC